MMNMMPYDDRKTFISDGCSWFPDLWFQECCVEHDYEGWIGNPRHQGDVKFMACIATKSEFLGPFAFIFAGIIVSGMALGRPIRNLWLKFISAFFKGAK